MTAVAEKTLLRRALIAALAGLALAAGIRYGVIEPAPLGWACQVADRPWWCLPRSALIAVLQSAALGWVALAAAVVALFGGGRTWGIAAAALGAAALFLYGAGPGSLALLLALLRALRLPAAAPAA